MDSVPDGKRNLQTKKYGFAPAREVKESGMPWREGL